MSMMIETAITFLKDASSFMMTILDHPQFTQQIIMIGLAIGFGFLIKQSLKTFFSIMQRSDKRFQTFSKKWFLNRLRRLILPLSILIFFHLYAYFTHQNIMDWNLASFAIKAIYLWCLYVALSIFITNAFIKTITILILLPAAALHIFNLYDQFVAYVEQYRLVLGGTNITFYTILKAIFFISIIFWSGKIFAGFIERYIRNINNVTKTTKELIVKVFDIFFYTVLGLITLNLVGIDLTALAIFSGALGVGLGFGLQKIASNFISGIILLSERSIKINNVIELQNGISGYLRTFGSRASVIETFDGKEVMVPNEIFITNYVSNLTHTSNKGRVEIDIPVAYETDLKLAFDLILQSVQNYQGSTIRYDADFAPKCYLKEFGDSSINFTLNFWLEDITGKRRAKSDILFKIWETLKANNIEIPFPQRDLHLKLKDIKSLSPQS